jgi:hypothetical protein
MDRFYRKDPKVHFRELAQMRQKGTLEAYVIEFQWMEVMVNDVSKKRLVILFTKGLDEPLRGWVKEFIKNTL